MMKSRFTTLCLSFFAMMFSTSMSAQNENTDSVSSDNVSTLSIDDLLKDQQKVSDVKTNTAHYYSVWSRNGYLNLVFNNATSTLTSAPADDQYVQGKQWKSDWGVSLMRGNNFKLHKPIANVLEFNIDFNYIDLTANHFSSKDGNSYNSENKYYNRKYLLRPWDEQRYEFFYSMMVGPSVTFAPLVNSSALGAHFLKINAYYHIGYNASLMYTLAKDVNPNTSSAAAKLFNSTDFLEFGHGLVTSFGFNISYKVIGLGYEHRNGTNKYQSTSSKKTGSEKFKMESSFDRFYVQFRF